MRSPSQVGPGCAARRRRPSRLRVGRLSAAIVPPSWRCPTGGRDAAASRRALIGADAFEGVLAPLVGLRVGYVRPVGHVGTALIEAAMAQLFGEFGIRWRRIVHPESAGVDVIAFGGGGLGRGTDPNRVTLTRCIASGLPVVVLPQSFLERHEGPCEAVFVRERSSLDLRPDGILAPDLALGLACPAPPPPRQDLGILLRRDHERVGRQLRLAQDPAAICRSPAEVLELAGRYRRIITDRVHFAIAGLHARRSVTLLPNNNHKNRSLHETWLAGLGCRFAESVEVAIVGETGATRRRFPAAA